MITIAILTAAALTGALALSFALTTVLGAVCSHYGVDPEDYRQ